MVNAGQEPPLGRYTPSDVGAEQHEVHLRGLPVQLLIESRERHDELLREFALLALSVEPPRSTLPAAFLELVEVLGVRYGSAAARPDAQIEEAVDAGLSTVDLTYNVPASVVQAAADLEHWMALADEYCLSEQLLTLPRTPLARALASWYLGEFRRQVSGEPPRPWVGPLAS